MGMCVVEFPWFGKVHPMVGDVEQVTESKQEASFFYSLTSVTISRSFIEFLT